jgi:capsular polysaccharide biosynthesis protein
MLEISVQNGNPEKACSIANTLSDVFVEEVKTFMNSEDVKIMDRAQLPAGPIKPRKMLNVVIAAFLGLMGSMGLVFLMEYLDNTIKTEDDVQKYLGLTVLASIPFVEEGK